MSGRKYRFMQFAGGVLLFMWSWANLPSDNSFLRNLSILTVAGWAGILAYGASDD